MPEEEYKTAYDSYAIDVKKYTIDPITGFLHLPIVFARVGVLDYPEDEESRFFPLEVLRAAANSADYGTMTKLHPDQDVSVANIKLVNKGVMKAGSTLDGEYLRGECIIQDEKFIDDVLNKRIIEVSSGYRYKDDGCPGEYKGKKYDTSLTFIKYNHFAGVPAGRAGKNVKFEIDKKGEPMADIEKGLPGLKVGNDQLLDGVTITFTKENRTAVDTMFEREKKLIKIFTDQADQIQTLEASLAANKESLKTIKTAQDGMIKPGDLNQLTAELLDVRQTAEKIGLDCKEEVDAHIVKQKVLEKMLPQAFKDLKDKDRLKSKNAVDAAYIAFKENMGFHQKVHKTKLALDGDLGKKAPVQSGGVLYKSFEQFPRS